MIDAHHHFWNPARGDYGWMPKDHPVLSKPYAPADLADALKRCGVAQTVLVQAAPSVAETEYLLGIADATPHVAKTVGWVDFEDPTQKATLDRLSNHPKFAGVRPMIQDIADEDWMLRTDIAWAFEHLVEKNLTFDCLGFPKHLPNFLELLKRYPTMRVVIDHCMKPQIGDGSKSAYSAWADGLSAMAEETQCFCKLSGLVTEAGSAWSDDVLQPYVDHVLKSFGAQRIMWGSDWPVVKLKCSYDDWYAQARRLTAHLSSADQARIFEDNARQFYRIS